MTKYYFFRVERENNAQNEYRTVLHPLPGQTTYKSCSERNVPLNTAYKVQVTSAEKHKIIQMPAGSIVGVAHEGHSERHCKLTEYSRNGVPFYRTEYELYGIDYYGPTISDLAIIERDSPMYLAYVALVNQNGQNEANQAQPQQTEAPRQEQSPSFSGNNALGATGGACRPDSCSRINTEELDSIEGVLLETMQGREMLDKLLIISQIRDRMRMGVAKFTFRKQNGDLRIAYGTRNTSILQMFNSPLGNNDQREAHDGRYFNYFDIQKHDWRRFCVGDILSVSVDFLAVDNETIMSIANTPAA